MFSPINTLVGGKLGCFSLVDERSSLNSFSPVLFSQRFENGPTSLTNRSVSINDESPFNMVNATPDSVTTQESITTSSDRSSSTLDVSGVASKISKIGLLEIPGFCTPNNSEMAGIAEGSEEEKYLEAVALFRENLFFEGCSFEFIGEGCFSDVYKIVGNNKSVFKVLKDAHINNARERIEYALFQYDCLNEIFKGVENSPFVAIYNRDEILEKGYTEVEKVAPLTESPWDKDTRIEDFTEQQLKDLESIKDLLWTDFRLRDGLPSPAEMKANDKRSPLDLKMDNLGRRKSGQIVLLDYVNQRFQECTTDEKSVIKRASMGNMHVEAHLEELATKNLWEAVLNPVEAGDADTLKFLNDFENESKGCFY